MEIKRNDRLDGAPVNVGEHLPLVAQQLLVPQKITREVSYSPNSPSVLISLEVIGGRYEVVLISLASKITPISTAFLTQLALPKVIQKMAHSAIVGVSHWANPDKNRKLNELELDEYLVQLYWFEHLTWGAPRQAIMNYTGWSRANTNWHIRRLAKTYTLPGAHKAKAKV